MQSFDPVELKKLYIPASASHKGQNGKLLIIGGSQLFHAASLWALQIASRIVDMVFYSSVVQNNQIVHELKKEFRNGIVVPRDQIEDYMREAEAVLIGPGMLRTEGVKAKERKSEEIINIQEINNLEDEGEQSYYLTRYLLEKYPEKKWVIDAGALQMLEPEWLLKLHGNVVLTPHPGELKRLLVKSNSPEAQKRRSEKGEGETVGVKKDVKKVQLEQQVQLFAKEYGCIILLKGDRDVVCSTHQCWNISGGNAGMTKGGTGDVLAGLVAGLACKNELLLAAKAGSFFNKKAGESLFQRVGYYFNASDLADEIPKVTKEFFIKR